MSTIRNDLQGLSSAWAARLDLDLDAGASRRSDSEPFGNFSAFSASEAGSIDLAAAGLGADEATRAVMDRLTELRHDGLF